MTLTILTICSAVFTFEAALLLAMGGFGLTARNIQQLAGTYWNYNPHVVESLSAQRWYSAGGVLLLSVAFALQLYSLLWIVPSRPTIDKGGTIAALIVSGVAGVLVAMLCRYIARRERAMVIAALKEQAHEGASTKN